MPILRKPNKVRARHPAAQDVSHYGDLESLHVAVDPAEAVQVEETLGGMLPGAVAGVHHRGICVASGHARRPHLGVTHDDDVRPVALQGEDGVLEALPFGDTG